MNIRTRVIAQEEDLRLPTGRRWEVLAGIPQLLWMQFAVCGGSLDPPGEPYLPLWYCCDDCCGAG